MFAACNNTSSQIDIASKTDSTLFINNSSYSKDTTIAVSFKGMVIGTSIRDYFGKVIPRSSRVEKLDPYCKLIFNTHITINSVQIPTEANVYCINDTISLIVAYIFPDHKNRDKFYELKDMYLTKYGESCMHCSLSDNSKSFIQLKNSDDHFGDIQIWDFNHVSISLIQVNHNWEKEDYEIDSYCNKVYNGFVEENLYGRVDRNNTVDGTVNGIRLTDLYNSKKLLELSARTGIPIGAPDLESAAVSNIFQPVNTNVPQYPEYGRSRHDNPVPLTSELEERKNNVSKGLVEETLYSIVVYCHKEKFPILLREIHKWNDYSDSIQREKQRIQDSIEMSRKKKIVIQDAIQI